jgi:NYN domain/OST-HTH/LOTUS domain
VPSPENVRIAVLIDADNTSPKHAEALLEEVAKYGVPTVKRAYGDWTDKHLTGWRGELPKYAIQPMLQIANTHGKNSTDSALIIDAMDLLYSGNVDAFALVSSDSDFTSLAIRLRGSGRTVYGLGLRKTPQSLRQAVDRFIYLEDLQDGGATEEVSEEAESRRIPDLRRLLERAVNGTAHDDGWASLSSMANHVTRVEPSFSVKDYGASKLVDLVRAQPYLDVEQPDSGAVRVRLRSFRTGKKAAAEKGAAKKGATKKGATKKEPSPEPTPEPVAETVAETARESAPEPQKHTVSTRKRSQRRTT